MTNHKIELFHVEHLQEIKPRAIHEFFYSNRDVMTALYNQNMFGLTWTINGEVAACGGIMEPWPKVGEVWMMTSSLVEKYPKKFYGYVKEMTADVSPMYRRLQACVRSDLPECLKFADRLGFKMEGLMKQYGRGGEDYYMMART